MITFDEDERTEGNHIVAFFQNVGLQKAVHNQSFNHYSITSFVEHNFGLGNLGQNDVNASNFGPLMPKIFQPKFAIWSTKFNGTLLSTHTLQNTFSSTTAQDKLVPVLFNSLPAYGYAKGPSTKINAISISNNVTVTINLTSALPTFRQVLLYIQSWSAGTYSFSGNFQIRSTNLTGSFYKKNPQPNGKFNLVVDPGNFLSGILEFPTSTQMISWVGKPLNGQQSEVIFTVASAV